MSLKFSSLVASILHDMKRGGNGEMRQWRRDEKKKNQEDQQTGWEKEESRSFTRFCNENLILSVFPQSLFWLYPPSPPPPAILYSVLLISIFFLFPFPLLPWENAAVITVWNWIPKDTVTFSHVDEIIKKKKKTYSERCFQHDYWLCESYHIITYLLIQETLTSHLFDIRAPTYRRQELRLSLDYHQPPLS